MHNEIKLKMLTDMAPTAAGQFYSSQIPTMGMQITNLAPHKAVSISIFETFVLDYLLGIFVSMIVNSSFRRDTHRAQTENHQFA